MTALISLADIWEAGREAFFMFWETLWALILGFTLSGAIQAFVSRDRMQRTMGDHRPASIARASGFGMISSSCSYAASAMAKSLFQKGADFVSAMVFMFASTNLVLELGIVLVVLMGWQFAAAQFVGGFIMIALLGITGTFVLRGNVAGRARARLGPAPETNPAREGIRTRAGWSDAAGYAMADINMVRRELVIGYAVAGVLTVLVPMDFWNAVFMEGHGFWTSLENALIGPVIAFVSFVCSIGNVPMAAALWHGGISFGGVISFIFADLLVLPLVLIYRKYYGTRLTLRLCVWFYAVMVVAALAVEGLFGVAGAIPPVRHETIVTTHFEWNYTTFLNIAFLVLFAILYRLSRDRARNGPAADSAFAIDPVCSMQVEKANAPAHAVVGGRDEWFCSDHCRERFMAGTH